jgi:hypothetical protein
VVSASAVVDLSTASEVVDVVGVVDPRAGERGGYRVGKHPVPERGPDYRRRSSFELEVPERPDGRLRYAYLDTVHLLVVYNALPREGLSTAVAIADASTPSGVGPGAGDGPPMSRRKLAAAAQCAVRTFDRHKGTLRGLGLLDWWHNCRRNELGSIEPLPNVYQLIVPPKLRRKSLMRLVKLLNTTPGRSISEFAAVVWGLAPDPRDDVAEQTERSGPKPPPRKGQGRPDMRRAVQPEPYAPPAPLTAAEAAETAALERAASRVQAMDRDELRTMLALVGAYDMAGRIDKKGPIGRTNAHMIAVILRSNRLLGDDDAEPP